MSNSKIALLHSIMDAAGVSENPSIDQRVAVLAAGWKRRKEERDDAESTLAIVNAELREEHRRLLAIGVARDDLQATIDKMRPIYDAANAWYDDEADTPEGALIADGRLIAATEASRGIR